MPGVVELNDLTRALIGRNLRWRLATQMHLSPSPSCVPARWVPKFPAWDWPGTCCTMALLVPWRARTNRVTPRRRA